MSLSKEMAQLFGVSKKAVRSHKPADSFNIKKVLTKAAKRETDSWIKFVFEEAVLAYDDTMGMADGSLPNEVKSFVGGRAVTRTEVNTELLAVALCQAVYRGYITEKQIDEQYELEWQKVYSSTGRFFPKRQANADMLRAAQEKLVEINSDAFLAAISRSNRS